MNGLQLLKTASFEEGVALAAVVRRASEIRRQDLEYLAVEIRNHMVEAWNSGNK